MTMQWELTYKDISSGLQSKAPVDTVTEMRSSKDLLNSRTEKTQGRISKLEKRRM